MDTWFYHGQIVDVILLLMALEILVLFFLKLQTGLGSHLLEFIATLLAGICLLLALRAALVSAPWPYIAFGLLTSLVFHVLALKGFCKRSSFDTLLRGSSSFLKTSAQFHKSEE